jgi:magnesium transporter
MQDSPHLELTDALPQILAGGDARALEAYLERLKPMQTARALAHLTERERQRLVALLSPEEVAEVISDLPDGQAADFLEEMHPEQAAAVVQEMKSEQQADLLGEIQEDAADQILSHFSPADARDARTLMEYPGDSAGGLMHLDFLSYPETLLVRDVAEDLHANGLKYSDYEVQYIFVTDKNSRLAGVLRLRDLVLSPGFRTVGQVMIPSPKALKVNDSLDTIIAFFDDHDLVGVPVVTPEGRIAGIVLQSDARNAVSERAQSSFLRGQGILGGEELRSMPFAARTFRRLAWLTLNIGLNLVAASVIARNEHVIEAAIALAFFIPIISDMSGSAGNQAAAVSLRELALGLATPKEIMRVIGKEAAAGLLLGVATGAMLAGVALVYKGSPWLGLVVGAALTVNTVLAAVVGGSLPLLLKRLKLDPGAASGVIQTTVTDMCGFFIVLKLAEMVLERL